MQSHEATTLAPHSRVADQMAIRIGLVDDHAVLRAGTRRILEDEPDLIVVGEASDGKEAIALALHAQPDVLVMDISMPHMDGIEATRRIRAEVPSIRVLGLSTHPRTEDHHPIEIAGASGLYTKGVDTQRLIEDLLVLHANTAARSAGDARML